MKGAAVELVEVKSPLPVEAEDINVAVNVNVRPSFSPRLSPGPVRLQFAAGQPTRRAILAGPQQSDKV